ncbi:MAG: hypothetical protein CO090_05140 [Acidobacteria bacterium CG_4_9_14_3_um_filter_49_7]|nr:MAG: hypothetical protein CO090_05140 [Acidobacteria bacterium CG_4_9_14_3_um_filter_49_7]
MKKLLFSAIFLISFLSYSVDPIPSSQLKKGMTGYGLTVFEGNHIEKFPVEVLGLLQNQTPGENRVLVRCGGPVIEKAGIISGMSGSPVYFDGKLAGAISFGWEFGKEPIGGLTPIENMQSVTRQYGTRGSTHTLRFEDIPDINKILNPDSKSFYPRELQQAFKQGFFVSSGFRDLPFSAVSASFAGEATDAPGTLKPGGAVAVALTRGSLNLYAIGTVTSVEGSYVLAFGHPLFGLGSISIPMHTASVLTTYPSIKSSNKLGAIGTDVGIVVEDRSAAILGVLGRKADMIPMTVKVNFGSTSTTYSLELAEHPLLTPFLTNLAVNNILNTACETVGLHSFNLKGRIDMSGHPSLKLDAMVIGTSMAGISGQITSLVQAVLQNPYDQVHIKGITLDLNYAEQLRMAQLIKVKSSRARTHPGETVHLQLYLKPFQRELFIKNITLTIPENMKPGDYHVEIGDGFSIMKRESKILKQKIESLDGFIRLVNNFLRNNKLYVGLAEKTSALYMGESVQSSLPASVMETVEMQGVHIPRTEKWKEFRAVDVLTLDDVVQGYFSFPLTVVAK